MKLFYPFASSGFTYDMLLYTGVATQLVSLNDLAGLAVLKAMW